MFSHLISTNWSRSSRACSWKNPAISKIEVKTKSNKRTNEVAQQMLESILATKGRLQSQKLQSGRLQYQKVCRKDKGKPRSTSFNGLHGEPSRKKGTIFTDGAVVRALASHQCGPGSTTDPGFICGLSLLLVLVLAPRGFSPGAPVFPFLKNNRFQIPVRSGAHEHVLTNF